MDIDDNMQKESEKMLFDKTVELCNLDSDLSPECLLESIIFQVKKGSADAWEFFGQLFSSGNARAMAMVASALLKCPNSTFEDVHRAKSLLENAMKHGEPNAIISLGDLHASGTQVSEKDPYRAKDLHEQAVRHGFPDAMHRLGCLLVTGSDGVVKNTMRAKSLLRRSRDHYRQREGRCTI